MTGHRDLGAALARLQDAITAPRPPAATPWSSAAGLAVYRHAYRARIEECIADDFPLCRQVLGRRAWSAFIRRFLADGPPPAGNINDLGSEVVPLLRRIHPDSAVADLARVEWAVVRAVHAPLATGLDPARLAAVADWTGMRLVPAPSLALIPCAHDVSGAWTGGPMPRRRMVAIVIRHPDGILRRTIPAGDGRLLRHLAAGRPLADALERVPLPPDRIRSVLHDTMSDRLFIDLRQDIP